MERRSAFGHEESLNHIEAHKQAATFSSPVLDNSDEYWIVDETLPADSSHPTSFTLHKS